jgi:hypothetical protein
MLKKITKNTYKKRLIGAAQAMEAHAFGQRVQVRERHKKFWKDLTVDCSKFDIMLEYRIIDEESEAN